MTLPVVFTANGPSGYNLTKSLRFRSSASAYLNRTPASATNRQTWTLSAWVKRGILSATQFLFDATAGVGTRLYFTSSDVLQFDTGGSGVFTTTQVFRDPSAWYHIVFVADTTQATASNRIKLYINGTQVTAFSATSYPAQNTNMDWNNNVGHYFGRNGNASVSYLDGYLAEINNIDGQALTPSSFGETSSTTGVWQPKKYTGSYGTNGFYLPFTDTTSTSTLGTDFSGNSNTWTVNNISLTSGSTYDSMTDVPTNTNSNTANYCVMNPLVAGTSSVLSNGNLTFTNSAGTGNQCNASMFVTSGSYYFEATLTTAGGGGTSQFVLVGDGNTSYSSNGQIYSGGVLQTTVATLTSGDVVGLAFTNGGSVTYYKNGTSVYTGGIGGAVPIVNGFSGTVWNVNFGQRPFAYTPPTGFVALNTFNLPTPTIGATASTTANKYMDVTLWTGDGTTNTRSFTNSGSMQPDWIWTKARSATWAHNIFDSVRGFANDKGLNSNLTDAEGTNRNGYVSAANSNGFSMANGTSGNQYYNENGTTYVGWQWRASNATAVTNTAGSITSTVSANTTAGFSIVTYTGTAANATVGHGLGVAPSMVIVKQRNTAQSWCVWHTSIGSANVLFLNSTSASTSYPTLFNSMSTLNSTVFSIGTDIGTNQNTGTYVAYCFTPIAGYSAFGSYTGNGSTDGTFIFTGFRPRYVMIKRSNTTGDWIVYDSARSTYNGITSEIYPNLSNAEDNSSVDLDFVSNGIKLRNSGSGVNASGDTYIYACFAENPFKYANAR